MAGELTETLSAPEFNITLACSTDLIPPATQKGIFIFSAIRLLCI